MAINIGFFEHGYIDKEAFQSVLVKGAPFISKFTCHDRHWQMK